MNHFVDDFLIPDADYIKSAFDEYRIKTQETRTLFEQNVRKKYRSDWISYSFDKEKITALYHFTDLDNLESIEKENGLSSWYYLEHNNINTNYMSDELSRKLDSSHGNHNYVHLSFCMVHPMARKLYNQGRKIVLLLVDPCVATWRETKFTDRNATDSCCHSGFSYQDLAYINLDAIRDNGYIDYNHPFYKLHQAEVMVKKHIPLEYILPTYFKIV